MTDYETLLLQIQGLVGAGEPRFTKLSNVAAALYWALPQVNWAGFYLIGPEIEPTAERASSSFDPKKLYLGPFHGQVACTIIPFGRGVCGTAAETKTVQRIENVHDFPGHIACDANSMSEIVLPILVQGEVVAVLDIDSPITHRFTEEDERNLREIVSVLEANW